MTRAIISGQAGGLCPGRCGASDPHLGVCVLRDCVSLASFEIPDSVTSIGNWAFSGCSSLTHLQMSRNLTSIGGNTFVDCTSLATRIGLIISAGSTACARPERFNLRAHALLERVTSLRAG